MSQYMRAKGRPVYRGHIKAHTGSQPGKRAVTARWSQPEGELWLGLAPRVVS